MENASKALIMTASVILGILIISFLVFVFGMFKDFNSENIEELNAKEDSKFNAEFFKYYENGKDTLKVTPQDIVSIANFVKENNSKYDLTESEENSYYVTIDVYTKDKKIYNFEKKTQEDYTNFIKQNNNIFKCSQIKINNLTKRVEYVRYEEV